ncbi:hypothetical protein ACSNOK_35475, partial [Streptomyces sp. URMC 126]|uniref:hypothetical protein n=1 Tax=Streptomyces sp. URMC 126 TaxID=3423401 RepID=UPI003F1CA30F
MSWGFNAWQTRPLYAAGARVGEADVQLGSEDKVPLVAPKAIALTFPAGLTVADPRVRIAYTGPLKAPIAKGAQVA